MEKRNSINEIYHYTSPQALYEILASNSIWLTSLRSSNDKEDLYFDAKRFHQMFGKLQGRIKDEVCGVFFNEVFNSTYINKIRYPNENTVYAASFTGKKDSIYHWKMYSDKMDGVCLGINKNELNKYLSKLSGLTISQVAYSDEHFTKVYGEIASWLAYDIHHYICNDDMTAYKEYLKEYGVGIAMIMQQFANATKKKKHFDVEDEIRLFYTPNPHLEAKQSGVQNQVCINNETNDLTPCSVEFGATLRDMFFCSPTYGIRQRITLQFGEAAFIKILTSITLGPFCRQSEYEIKQFLNAIGANHVKVIKSNIKIR